MTRRLFLSNNSVTIAILDYFEM